MQEEAKMTPRRYQNVECSSTTFFKKQRKHRQSGIIDAYTLQKMKNKQGQRQKRIRNRSQTATNDADAVNNISLMENQVLL